MDTREAVREIVVDTGGWQRWALAFALVGISILAAAIIVIALFPGDGPTQRIETAYRLLWENTTQRQFTFIMQDNPWVLIIPAAVIIFATGLALPLNYWSRAAYVYLAFGLGVVFGHVFW